MTDDRHPVSHDPHAGPAAMCCVAPAATTVGGSSVATSTVATTVGGLSVATSTVATTVGGSSVATSSVATTVGGSSVATTSGRLLGLGVTTAGTVSWLGWLSWRIARPAMSPIGVTVLALELVAFAASLVISAGLFAGRAPWRQGERRTDAGRQLPVLLAEALDIGHIIAESDVDEPCGAPLVVATADGQRPPRPKRLIGSDDTGEIAWARRGIRVLGEQRRLDARSSIGAQNLREAAWSVVALDGLRRLASVVALMVVLFTGRAPFIVPPAERAAMLAGGVALVAVGHWLLSGGHLRPGSRTLWSMASIGAGLGDGISRSTLPIRWMVTMATLVTLNIAVALRGMSDRWTHGLEPMERDARIVAMSAAATLVAVGGVALRRMPHPELDFYGATRRLEETSVRRLAIGLTLSVAAVGFVAGVLPVAVP